MKFGTAFFPTAEAMPPGELGRLVEERGHESLFFAEHTHIPASRRSPWPAGGELPPKYARTYDPFVACTAVAAATTRLRVGTGICLVIERDPITTAKEVASVDRLSGGRFEFGVGAGWNREEMENHGTDPRRRMALMAERIEAMVAIWTEDEASYHGEFVDFTSITSWPKPVQKPHPPIYVGGHGPKVFDRVLRYADGWLSNYEEDAVGTLAERIADLRERGAAAGRDHIPVRYFGADRDRGALERLTEAGVDEIQFYLEPLAPDEAERQLDEVAELVASTRA